MFFAWGWSPPSSRNPVARSGGIGLEQPIPVVDGASSMTWQDAAAARCVPGEAPLLVVTDPSGASIRSLAVDATHVWWTSEEKSGVLRAPRAGGPVETVTEGAAPGPDSLVVASDSLFWTDSGGVMRLRRAGPFPAQPTVLAAGRPTATVITVDGDDLFWGNASPDGKSSILRTSINTGITSQSGPVPDAPRELALTPDRIYYTLEKVRDVGWIYRSSGSHTKVDRLPQELRPTVASDLNTVYAAADTKLYKVVPQVGWATATVLFSVPFGINKLIVDGGAAWTRTILGHGAGQLYRVALDDGARTLIVDQLPADAPFAFDEGCVYWADYGGRILRTAR